MHIEYNVHNIHNLLPIYSYCSDNTFLRKIIPFSRDPTSNAKICQVLIILIETETCNKDPQIYLIFLANLMSYYLFCIIN